LSAREQKRLGRGLPTSARAYEFYLRANQLSRQSEMLPIAERLYRSALEEDPDYAPAWAHLGRVCRLLAKYGVEHASANLERAEQAFARALAIDPDLSAAHHLYTYFEVESLGRPKEAMARLLVRLQTDAANPELFAALVLACRYCGLLDASLAADRQARRLDPAIRTSVAYTYFMLADWTRAIEHDVDDVRWVTNWCLPMLGREREAIAAYHELAARPLPERMRKLGVASRLAIERKRDECLEAMVSFQDQEFDPEGLYFAGRALIRVDESEHAIDMLERVVERGFFCLEAFVRDPWLDPVRRDARFQKLVHRAEQRWRDAEHELRQLDSRHALTA
jgi:tetratricopeptide (TPR) repeat protein